jgi:ATP-binding cassette, subfamily B, bacterial PglK
MFTIFRRSWRLLDSPEKRKIGFLVVARILSNAFDVLALALLGLSIAMFVDREASQRLVAWLPDEITGDPAVMLTVTGVLFVAKSVLAVSLGRWVSILLAQIQVEKSERVAAALFSRGLLEIKKWSQPRLNWLILNSTESAFYGVLTLAVTLIAELTSVVFLVTLMLFVALPETLLALSYFLLVISAFHYLARAVFSREGRNNAAGSVSSGQILVDFLSAYREISVLGKVRGYVSALVSSKATVARSNAINSFMGSLPRVILETALVLGALAFVGIQASGVLGPIDLASVGVLVAGSFRLMGALLPIQRAITEFKYIEPLALEAQTALEEIFVAQLEEKQSAKASRPRIDVLHRESKGVGIELDSLVFSFEESRRGGFPPENQDLSPTIGPVTLSVAPGAYVALVGHSGAGKSTLVDLMLGLYDPSAGVVKLDGLSPRDFMSANPGQVGYVPQSPGLVSGTILDNIALGVPREALDPTRLQEAIRLAELDDFIHGLPEGQATYLGALVDGLSGGQRQRIGLARALYVKPRLLVLDEATSALDPKTEKSITDSLQGLRGSMTIFVIAHRLSTVQKVDEIFVFERGELLGSGSFDELRQSSPTIRNYIELLSFDP